MFDQLGWKPTQSIFTWHNILAETTDQPGFFVPLNKRTISANVSHLLIIPAISAAHIPRTAYPLRPVQCSFSKAISSFSVGSASRTLNRRLFFF
jgi:hypothetical protein